MYEIKISDLKKVAVMLLAHVEELQEMSSFNFEEDYYWEVMYPARFDMLNNPDGLGAGQLTDDITELKKLASGEKEPGGFDLTYLASVLRTIGEKYSA